MKKIFIPSTRSLCLVSTMIWALIAVSSSVCAQDSKIYFYCIGDSITWGQAYGSGHEYPRLLQGKFREIGMDNVTVVNQGVSGDTVGARLNYWQGIGGERTLQRRDVHYVTIMLGTNDTRVGDETPLATFVERMNALIDVFANHTNLDGTKPQVLLSLIPPHNSPQDGEYMASQFKDRFIHRDRIPNELNPALIQIAQERGLQVIDLYTPLKAVGPDLLPDGLHPGEEGDTIIADTFFAILRPIISPAAGVTSKVSNTYQ